MTFSEIGASLACLGGLASLGVIGTAIFRRSERRLIKKMEAIRQEEREAGQHLCFSTIESLAYAIEAGDPYNMGHLDCVLRCAVLLARQMHLSEEEISALRAAALLHNIGRLGVPEHILHKAEALTPEEQEKLRAHPVLGARILASIPFPWPVVPMVRHHAEHWNGEGYPGRLKGEEIPVGARILAVVNSYSALLRPRPFRYAFSPADAFAEIEARAGTQYDPAVVDAFRPIADQMREEGEDPFRTQKGSIKGDTSRPKIVSLQSEHEEARIALDDIASAQRETLGLYTLSQAVSGSLHLEELCNTVIESAMNIVPCAACVLFLPEDDNEYLRAHAAIGTNERHLLGSLARVGTYLTGRAFFRSEMMRATFLRDDLILRDVSDVWQPFRSTLIVPLMAHGEAIGTLNLYAEEPDAFGQDAQRVMRLVATQAGRAIDSARRYDAARETAYTDALTGLRNGRYLREYLERELNRASRDGSSLAVINIDLDNFKPINDGFGHARGDQTLKEVAEILSAHVRNYDLAARYAGDEFVLVLARSDRAAAEAIAHILKAAVERHGQRLISREPNFPQIGVSCGVAVYPEDGKDLQSLLCNSDAAMYSDKTIRKISRSAA